MFVRHGAGREDFEKDDTVRPSARRALVRGTKFLGILHVALRRELRFAERLRRHPLQWRLRLSAQGPQCLIRVSTVTEATDLRYVTCRQQNLTGCQMTVNECM